MGCVHALMGAGFGALFGGKQEAFAAGVVSHIIGDILPHNDPPVVVEVGMLGAVLLGLWARYGTDSPQFAGALGAITPDIENALVWLGFLREGSCLFPTHNNLLPHYKCSGCATQVIAGILGLASAELLKQPNAAASHNE